jgi:hypothetical protein
MERPCGELLFAAAFTVVLLAALAALARLLASCRALIIGIGLAATAALAGLAATLLLVLITLFAAPRIAKLLVLAGAFGLALVRLASVQVLLILLRSLTVIRTLRLLDVLATLIAFGILIVLSHVCLSFR